MIDTIIKLEKSLNDALKNIRVSKNLEQLRSYLTVDSTLTTTNEGSLTIKISLDFVLSKDTTIPIVSNTVLYSKPTTTDPCMEVDTLSNKFFDHVITWLTLHQDEFNGIVDETYKQVE